MVQIAETCQSMAPHRLTSAEIFLFLEQADYKSDHRHDGENHEENLGDFDSTCCNAPETKDGCNKCNNQKYD
jgi:hypothetical protein